MTLKLSHKDTKAIWEWLSKYSDVKYSVTENKRRAMQALKIVVRKYVNYFLCPYCKYSNFTGYKSACLICPIYERYKERCTAIGYIEWVHCPTPKNALVFYNRIKDL